MLEEAAAAAEVEETGEDAGAAEEIVAAAAAVEPAADADIDEATKGNVNTEEIPVPSALLPERPSTSGVCGRDNEARYCPVTDMGVDVTTGVTGVTAAAAAAAAARGEGAIPSTPRDVGKGHSSPGGKIGTSNEAPGTTVDDEEEEEDEIEGGAGGVGRGRGCVTGSPATIEDMVDASGCCCCCS